MVTLKGLLRLLRAVPFWRPRVLRTLFSEGLTLSALISIAALKNPDGTALIDDDGPLTYADLNHLIDEATADLQTTRVDVQEPNHRSFVVAVAAALRQSADVVLHEPSKSPPPQSSQHSTPSRRRGQIILLTSAAPAPPKKSNAAASASPKPSPSRLSSAHCRSTAR